MALIYAATLEPGKLELLSSWLPARPWAGEVPGLEQVGAYRFDDPAGEVGIEGFVLRTGEGTLLHVPVTYRAAALEGAQEHLVGTCEHSVLGTRWVYDACGDPVWAAALATTVLGGGSGAEELLDSGDGRAPREPSMTVRGSGSTPWVGGVASVTSSDDEALTVVEAGALTLHVVRVVGAGVPDGETLTGRWTGGAGVLAGVSRS